MVTRHAVEGLLELVAKSPIVDSSAKISLFSLGNLAMHAFSRELLVKLGCDRITQNISAKAKVNRDNQSMKYCDRLLLKLQQGKQLSDVEKI
jgi:hypothetical protein